MLVGRGLPVERRPDYSGWYTDRFLRRVGLSGTGVGSKIQVGVERPVRRGTGCSCSETVSLMRSRWGSSLVHFLKGTWCVQLTSQFLCGAGVGTFSLFLRVLLCKLITATHIFRVPLRSLTCSFGCAGIIGFFRFWL